MQRITDELTIKLMEDGLAMLRADQPSEVVRMVESLVAHRPESVTESEKVHYLTAMAGVTLGLGLAKSNRAIEDAGGFAVLAEKYIGPEAANFLQESEQ